MPSLTITDADGDNEIDRVTLSNNKLTYKTGAARDMFDNLIRIGYTPAQAFEMRTDWSNGYMLAKPV